MRADRGVTLLEATIVLSMMIGLMVLMTMFFVRGQRYTLATEAYAGVQRQASLLLGKITSELYRASAQQMVIGEDHDEIAVLSNAAPQPQAGQAALEFDENSGLIVWKKWVAFYHDPTRNELRRLETPLSSVTTDLETPVSPSVDFPVWRLDSDGQTLGVNVLGFQVSESPGGVSVSLSIGKDMPLPNLTEDQKELVVNVVMEIHMIN